MSDAGAPALTSLSIKNPIAADIAAFIGEVARPVGLFLIALSIFIGFVGGKSDATQLGIMMTGFVTLYGVKGTEKIFQTRADSAVKQTMANAEADVKKTEAAAASNTAVANATPH